MGKLTKQDDKIIFDLYVNKRKSSVEIGKIFQTTHRTILNHLNKMGVERRNLSESQFAKNDKNIRFLDEDNLITYCKKCHLCIAHGSNKTIRSEVSNNEERSTTTAVAGTS